MAKPNYHITIKGYVGGSDFDRTTVDRVLTANECKHVDVLLDSLGGSVTTGQTLVSMQNLLREHRKNCVFFAGINNKL